MHQAPSAWLPAVCRQGNRLGLGRWLSKVPAAQSQCALRRAPLSPRPPRQAGSTDPGVSASCVLTALPHPPSGSGHSPQMRLGTCGPCEHVLFYLVVCSPRRCPIYSVHFSPPLSPSVPSRCIFLEENGAVFSTGTNDKPGGPHYVLRWTSPQVIKETHKPLGDWRYSYMQ